MDGTDDVKVLEKKFLNLFSPVIASIKNLILTFASAFGANEPRRLENRVNKRVNLIRFREG